MRVLLFGKTRNVARLVEDPAEDLRLAGHEVCVFPYRASKLTKTLDPWLLSERLGVPLATLLQRRIDAFRPDLIVAFGPYHWLPPAVFGRLRHRPPMVAWVGDLFDAEMAKTAALFDIVAYTDTGMLGGTELATIYASHLGALNIRHEHNVINGLNQRHFAPYIVGTPVNADAQGDIEQCFDPGHEILVYRDAAELSAIQTMLRANPTKARDVGEAGHKRVMAQHTYAHRIETVAALAGVRKFR